MNSKAEVIIIRESLQESVVRDLISAAVLLGMVGIGLWLNSAALQWVGAIVWILWVFSRSIALVKSNRMTLDQAEAKLRELRGE